MIKVLLCGPVLGRFKNAYGGGVGGYTRNMSCYLEKFKNDKFQFIPFFHTVRGQSRFGFLPLRLIIDVVGLVFSIIRYKPDVLHILGQYRTAVFREAAWVLISNVFGVKLVYEIKAGSFEVWYNKGGSLVKMLMRYIIKSASYVLAEGKVYVNFVKDEFGQGQIIYHPNFVEDISQNRSRGFFENDKMNILFVGYQYEGKGVFDLVEACSEYSKQRPIRLTLIGKEHPDFTHYLDTNYTQTSDNFILNRQGVLSYEEVTQEYFNNDIYCYPSRHKGEGHNNTITEAMLSGLIVASTKTGFIPDFLNEKNGYLIQESKKEEILKTLKEIDQDKEGAVNRGGEARKTIRKDYILDNMKTRLKKIYKEVLE